MQKLYLTKLLSLLLNNDQFTRYNFPISGTGFRDTANFQSHNSAGQLSLISPPPPISSMVTIIFSSFLT